MYKDHSADETYTYLSLYVYSYGVRLSGSESVSRAVLSLSFSRYPHLNIPPLVRALKVWRTFNSRSWRLTFLVREDREREREVYNPLNNMPG